MLTSLAVGTNGTPHNGKQRRGPVIGHSGSDAQTWSGGHSSPFGQARKFGQNPDVQAIAKVAQANVPSTVVRQLQQVGSSPHPGPSGDPPTVQVHPVQKSPSGQIDAVPAQVPSWQAMQVPSGSLAAQAVPFATGVVVQTPAGLQTAVLHWLAAGQSSTVRHRQRRRPLRSLSPHNPVQQFAFSRQTLPGARQLASASRSPTSPRAPATTPPSKRRREPDSTSERVRASNLQPSKAASPTEASKRGSADTIRGRRDKVNLFKTR
jgi:hypothetical protein